MKKFLSVLVFVSFLVTFASFFGCTLCYNCVSEAAGEAFGWVFCWSMVATAIFGTVRDLIAMKKERED